MTCNWFRGEFETYVVGFFEVLLILLSVTKDKKSAVNPS